MGAVTNVDSIVRTKACDSRSVASCPTMSNGAFSVAHGEGLRTLWATTRIVKLLRLAEQHTQTVDGMMLLSRAGQFIKGQAPDLSANEYGLKTLKEILIASGLFHVTVA